MERTNSLYFRKFRLNSLSDEHLLNIKNEDQNGEPPLLSSSTLSEQGNQPDRRSRKEGLLLAFALLFIPMLGTALALLAFVFSWNKQVTFLDNGTLELPVTDFPPDDSYYTRVSVGKLTLVSAWACHIASYLAPPFMLFFSHIVAQELVTQTEKSCSKDGLDNLLQEVLNGTWLGTWQQLISTLHNVLERTKKSYIKLKPTHLIAMGLTFAAILALLILAGDTWFHLAVESSSLRYYEAPVYPLWNVSEAPRDGSPYAAGWAMIDACDSTLTTVLPSNVSSAPLPCSLNQLAGVNITADLDEVLNSGLSQLSLRLPGYNYTDLGGNGIQNAGSRSHVASYIDPSSNLSHSFLFYPDAAVEHDVDAFTIHYGIDYLASTTSMSTECVSITQACQFNNQSSPKSQDMSVTFNCSEIFFGDFNQTHWGEDQHVRGWDSKFYELVGGNPENILLQASSNPFTFNISAAMDSLLFSDLEAAGKPQALDGSIVNASNGRLAFALSCTATIYDVAFSLINGSIAQFNATPSDPRKASIIKAPLQAGFGKNQLFQAASHALLHTNDTVAHLLGKPISQTGIALASGAFNRTNNKAMRIRYDTLVTRVPKAPYWFLVSLCLSYAAIAFFLLGAAMTLHRSKRFSKEQRNPGLLFRASLLDL